MSKLINTDNLKEYNTAVNNAIEAQASIAALEAKTGKYTFTLNKGWNAIANYTFNDTDIANMSELINRIKADGKSNVIISFQTYNHDSNAGDTLDTSTSWIMPLHPIAECVMQGITEEFNKITGISPMMHLWSGLTDYSGMYFPSISGTWTDGVFTCTSGGINRKTVPYPLKADVLRKDNKTAFTPTGDYNPATKKYVDDKVANAGETLTLPAANIYTSSSYSSIYLSAEKDANYGEANNEALARAINNALSKIDYDILATNSSRYCAVPLNLTPINLIWGSSAYPVTSATTSHGNTSSTYVSVTLRVNKFGISNAMGNTGSPVMYYQFYYNYSYSVYISAEEVRNKNITRVYTDQALTTATYLPESKSSIKVYNNYYSFLPTNNTTEYTPTKDYHPSTKKYVDDNVCYKASLSGSYTENPTPRVVITSESLTSDIIAKLIEKGSLELDIAFNMTAGSYSIDVTTKCHLSHYTVTNTEDSSVETGIGIGAGYATYNVAKKYAMKPYNKYIYSQLEKIVMTESVPLYSLPDINSEKLSNLMYEEVYKLNTNLYHLFYLYFLL